MRYRSTCPVCRREFTTHTESRLPWCSVACQFSDDDDSCGAAGTRARAHNPRQPGSTPGAATTARRLKVALLGVLLALAGCGTGCALFRSTARTAIDIAREACDIFLAEQPASEQPLGMDLDTCAETLLSAQRGKVAAARQANP